VKEDHVSKEHSKSDREDPAGAAVGQRIAELAELVAAGCRTPIPSSYVREEFEALVDEIRARASEGTVRAPQRSSTRLKHAPEGRSPAAGSFEFRSDPLPAREAEGGRPRVVSLDDARGVLDALRREESSGGGPREDLQRAIA
jgi:hypothetical protein